MVLRGGERQSRLAVDQREEARFLAVEKFLDHELGARGAERAAEAILDRRVRLLARLRDHHALSRRQPVRLDDDRQALRRDISFGGARFGEAAIGGGWDAVFGAKILGEAFGAFEPRGCSGRPEHFHPGGFEIVGETGDQRRLGADHHEADVILLAEADHRFMVRHVERHALGDLGDSGIARRAIEPAEQGALPELPGERVLAASAPDQQHIHLDQAPLVAHMPSLYCMRLVDANG